MIYLPEQRFLMAVDTITPGEAPFMNFGGTSNLEGYMASFETFLAHDFEHFLSGHVSVLGNRQDVETARDYAFDVRDTVGALWPGFMDRFMANMELTKFQHGNLAYRMTMEQIRDDCAGQIVDRLEGHAFGGRPLVREPLRDGGDAFDHALSGPVAGAGRD